MQNAQCRLNKADPTRQGVPKKMTTPVRNGDISGSTEGRSASSGSIASTLVYKGPYQITKYTKYLSRLTRS